ncbi:TWiK family of potassium channels protein 18-like isoform X2 [Cimex lectularius]|uniref:Potassium channel domain-containing protein n=1 Tax=Cimex lectularius TaxID=79782 RepID=A0A8I6TDN5_CIMLE|nr:TWiK family of potassium channels protein 18-like isoform X2 [Cimex lectularius]
MTTRGRLYLQTSSTSSRSESLSTIKEQCTTTVTSSSDVFPRHFPFKAESKKTYKNWFGLFWPSNFKRDPSNQGHYDFWMKGKRWDGTKWFEDDDWDDYDIPTTDLFALPPIPKRQLTPKEEKKRLKEEKKAEERAYMHKLREQGLTWKQRLLMTISYKIAQYTKTWLAHIFLVIALFLYTVLGAYMFHIIEGNDDELVEGDPFGERESLTSLIKEIQTKKMSREDGDQVLRQALKDYEISVFDNLGSNSANERGKDELNWGFWSAFFFCFTVYTTIGFGHMSPSTLLGRIVVIIYAIIGIPLFLIIMADLGKAMTRTCKLIWLLSLKTYHSKTIQRGKIMIKRSISRLANTEDPYFMQDPEIKRVSIDFEIDDRFDLPVTLAILILIAYLFLGAILFAEWEGYEFIASFYFVFVSLTTVGFGDLVPQNADKLMVCILFLTIGLSLASMCVAVVRPVF